MRRNLQLYARILRLSMLLSPSMSADKIADMDRIVVDVIYPDSDLIWC